MGALRRAITGAAMAVLAGCEGYAPHTDDPGAGPYPLFPPPVPQPGESPAPAASPTPSFGECNAIYDPDVVPTFELRIAPAEWGRLRADFDAGLEIWRPAESFHYDGETVEKVMVRIRGNTGTCGDRMQLAIAFHKIDEDQRFRGLRRINLDHGSCHLIYERISMEFAREEAGLPAPCANNARLVVNGELYGVFANLEHQDREYLERNFDLPDGNLYQVRQKKTNEDDPDTSDLDALEDAETPEQVAELVDLDEAVRMWAVEALLPAADNYWYFGRNYMIYNHPERGFVYLPNDYDHALPLGWNWDWDPVPPNSTIATIVLADPYWKKRYLEELEAMRALFSEAWYSERLDRYWAQMREHAMADPLITIDDAEIERLKEYFRQRELLLDAKLPP